MNRHTITKSTVVNRMVAEILSLAIENHKDLRGITITNFNSFLDDLFEDGGEARCERFCDLAWPYSLQFGKLESTEFEAAQWSCIEAAIEELRRRLS